MPSTMWYKTLNRLRIEIPDAWHKHIPSWFAAFHPRIPSFKNIRPDLRHAVLPPLQPHSGHRKSHHQLSQVFDWSIAQLVYSLAYVREQGSSHNANANLSLDIEGAEFLVLQTIPWDKVDIEVGTHSIPSTFDPSLTYKYKHSHRYNSRYQNVDAKGRGPKKVTFLVVFYY